MHWTKVRMIWKHEEGVHDCLGDFFGGDMLGGLPVKFCDNFSEGDFHGDLLGDLLGDFSIVEFKE